MKIEYSREQSYYGETIHEKWTIWYEEGESDGRWSYDIHVVGEGEMFRKKDLDHSLVPQEVSDHAWTVVNRMANTPVLNAEVDPYGTDGCQEVQDG